MGLISIAFQVSVFATVLGYGMHADRRDIEYVFRRPRLLVLSLLAMFVVMPVIAPAATWTSVGRVMRRDHGEAAIIAATTSIIASPVFPARKQSQ